MTIASISVSDIYNNSSKHTSTNTSHNAFKIFPPHNRVVIINAPLDIVDSSVTTQYDERKIVQK